MDELNAETRKYRIITIKLAYHIVLFSIDKHAHIGYWEWKHRNCRNNYNFQCLLVSECWKVNSNYFQNSCAWFINECQMSIDALCRLSRVLLQIIKNIVSSSMEIRVSRQLDRRFWGEVRNWILVSLENSNHK